MTIRPIVAAWLVLQIAVSCNNATKPETADYIEMFTPEFNVPQGEELQHNYFMDFPSEEPVYINRIHLFMNEGSHHFNVYRLLGEDPTYADGGFESSFDTRFFNPPWQLIIDNQSGDIDWSLPAGVAFRIEAHEKLNLQLHYTNTQTQPTPANAQGTVRWYTVEQEEIEQEAAAFFAWNPNVLIPPHSEASFTKTCIMPQTIHLMALTGHFHSRGKEFRVWTCNAQQEKGELIFESTTWDEPPFVALDPPVTISEGEGIIYTCTYDNPTDVAIPFGGHNITEEHSNVFAFFYPRTSQGNINFIGADTVEVGVYADSEE